MFMPHVKKPSSVTRREAVAVVAAAVATVAAAAAMIATGSARRGDGSGAPSSAAVPKLADADVDALARKWMTARAEEGRSRYGWYSDYGAKQGDAVIVTDYPDQYDDVDGVLATDSDDAARAFRAQMDYDEASSSMGEQAWVMGLVLELRLGDVTMDEIRSGDPTLADALTSWASENSVSLDASGTASSGTDDVSTSSR